MFEINYSQLIQYEILEKLVTYMGCQHKYFVSYYKLHLPLTYTFILLILSNFLKTFKNLNDANKRLNHDCKKREKIKLSFTLA